jgi:hypothetical protein
MLGPNPPAWDQFNEVTTGWLLNAHSPTEERAVWRYKMAARKLYERTHDPEGLALRMLLIALRDDARSVHALAA